MRTISATDFKARCLAILDEVGSTGDKVIIEKRGKPIAQLTSFVDLDTEIPQQSLTGTARFIGDITAPVVAPDEWAVMRNHT